MKKPRASLGLFEAFLIIEDPRAANASYPLIEVLFCVLVAICCGADSFVEAEEVANDRKSFIRRYVPLRRGVPSHNTMGLVFASIDPNQFAVAMARFIATITGRPRQDIINLDGKALRGVVGAANTRDPDAVAEQVQMLNAFSVVRRVVLAQLRSKHAVSEVEAAHDLLEMLELKHSVVTLDAAHMNQKALEIIAKRGGDAIITVKANNPRLVKDIEDAFREDKNPKVVTTSERKHGKTERRKYEFTPARGKSVTTKYKTVKMFARVTRDDVTHASKAQRGARDTYYVITFDDPEFAAECIRKRWSIENGLHYVLDVTFKEDSSRVRVKHAAENFSRARHLAFGLLSTKKAAKAVSFKSKRRKALIDDRFLASVLRLPFEVTTEMG